MPLRLRQEIQILLRKVIYSREGITISNRGLIEEVIRGFIQDIALRLRYQEEGFGLETSFDKEEQARARISELKKTYGLSNGDIRLVQYISSRQKGDKITWEVYVKAGKGLKVLFL